MIVKRGEVWLAAPGRRSAHSARNARPFLVVSPPELLALRTVIVAPVATKGPPAPFRPALRIGGGRAFAVLDQLRTLDQSMLMRRVGALSPATLNGVLATLQLTFAL